MQLLGIDLAWQSPQKQAGRNTSGLAFGSFNEGQLVVDDVIPYATVDKDNLGHIEDHLNKHGVSGVAIDAPLIIPSSAERMRTCERELSKAYGHLGAGCYPTNIKKYGNAPSVSISKFLKKKGFVHLGEENDQWQIECYPHPALIELFNLSERLLYKKGKKEIIIKGQLALIEMLFEKSPIPIHGLQKIEEKVFLASDKLNTLTKKELKRNEDALDALVCLLTAACYAKEKLDGRIFGDSEKGYIYVPLGNKAKR